MRALRTPEARLRDVAGFAYEPRYAQVHTESGDELRMAWVEDGPAEHRAVLLVHGASGWSFQFRRVIPPLASSGVRAIAVDLVGSGRSDKPDAVSDYTLARQVDWLSQLAFDVLDLHAVTLLAVGWGAMVGLRLVSEHPQRFARIATANAFAPTHAVHPPEVYLRGFRQIGQAGHIDFGSVASAWAFTPFEADVTAAYNAPFPDESFQAGARAPYCSYPCVPEDSEAAANEAALATLSHLHTPALVASSDGDLITADYAEFLRGLLPGARGRTHPCYSRAGFIVEDAPLDLAHDLITFIHDTPHG